MKKLIITIISFMFLMSCSGSPKIVRYQAPASPNILPVKVVNGTISGKSKDNVIKNHARAWEFIHILLEKAYVQ